ncbi:MAG: hypothetical protein HY918_02040 [Candidatus Doudnabacteria bacterium]|nr:hypothetical protein [Candidatus Doudnabacteria bacterium]
MEKSVNGREIERPQFSLKDLFKSLKKETPYGSLISDQIENDGNKISTPYSFKTTEWLQDQHLLQQFPEIQKDRDYIKGRLSSSVLVDLGGGRSLMKTVAKSYGSLGYINTDLNSESDEVVDPFSKEGQEILLNGTDEFRSVLVKMDMLDFVSRLPDNSVNFTANGIDNFIIGRGKYNNALAKEITRTLKPGGIIFGNDMSAIEDELCELLNEVPNSFPRRVQRPYLKIFEKL